MSRGRRHLEIDGAKAPRQGPDCRRANHTFPPGSGLAHRLIQKCRRYRGHVTLAKS